LKVFIAFISNKYILIKVYDFMKFYLFMLHGLHVVILVAQLGGGWYSHFLHSVNYVLSVMVLSLL